MRKKKRFMIRGWIYNILPDFIFSATLLKNFGFFFKMIQIRLIWLTIFAQTHEKKLIYD